MIDNDLRPERSRSTASPARLPELQVEPPGRDGVKLPRCFSGFHMGDPPVTLIYGGWKKSCTS